MGEKTSKHGSLGDLLALIRTLRSPDGCPWDREQQVADLKQYLLDECYEVMEAIDSNCLEKLREELGDLLFQIVFLAYMAEEAGAFHLDDVLTDIHEKMVRRHPHVFGEVQANDTATVKRNWWKIKKAEGTAPASQLDAVPRNLPALQRAFRLGQRASRAGLDWTDPASVLEKVKEEVGELESALRQENPEGISEELGDILFTLANLGRHLKQNPEESLHRSNNKFLERFHRMEQCASQEGRRLEAMSPEELDRWWNDAKET